MPKYPIFVKKYKTANLNFGAKISRFFSYFEPEFFGIKFNPLFLALKLKKNLFYIWRQKYKLSSIFDAKNHNFRILGKNGKNQEFIFFCIFGTKSKKKIEFLDGNCSFSIVLSNRKLSILAKCIWCSSVYCCPTDDNPIEMITIESFPPPAWGSFCRPPPTLPIFLKKCGAAAAWKIENRILIVIWEKSNRKCIWPYG